MHASLKKRLLGILCIFSSLCITLCINANAGSAMHWYCKRNSEHKQPQLDTALSFIEQCNGVYVDKAHGDDDPEKVIYLTFDAGYENGNVAKTLDVLKNEDVCGAFFILGNLIKRNPDLIMRMVDEGHLVCNHTNNHKDITKLDKQDLLVEINSLEQAYTELSGKPLDKYFRPPEGTFDQDSLSAVNECGYKTVFWSFAYADWDNENQMSAQAAKKKIFDNLHNGEIMLLHPTSATNAEILTDVIRELKAMGYRFGPLDELFSDEA